MLTKAKSDPKKLYDAIKKVSHIGKNCSTVPDLPKTGTTPDIAVNKVNTFFVNLSKNLTDGFAGSSYNDRPLNVINGDSCNYMVLKETDDEEV